MHVVMTIAMTMVMIIIFLLSTTSIKIIHGTSKYFQYTLYSWKRQLRSNLVRIGAAIAQTQQMEEINMTMLVLLVYIDVSFQWFLAVCLNIQGQPQQSGSALDCRSTGPAINLYLRFLQPKLSLAQDSLAVQNQGLKHHSFVHSFIQFVVSKYPVSKVIAFN